MSQGKEATSNQPFEIPPNWGKDAFSNFFETARLNLIATSKLMPQEYNRLDRIDHLYLQVIDYAPHNSPEVLPAFFLLRAHSSYRTACGLAASGQVADSHAIMRQCIETSLYGFHVFAKPEAAHIWMNRNDDVDAHSKAKNEFKYGNVKATLSETNARLGTQTDRLYNLLIEEGGHPNFLSIFPHMQMKETQEDVEFKHYYLNPGGFPQKSALMHVSIAGIISLSIFREVWKTRFDLMNLTQQIEKERPNPNEKYWSNP